MLGGGLGSQPHHAELLRVYSQSNHSNNRRVLRIFDRYGERAKRLKARLKF
jgi:sulfite reductase (ferredoxin)